MNRHRGPDQPHAEIHHEGDGWHVDAYDVDPVRGLIVMHAVVLTFAAAIAWFDALRRVTR